jgi:hypothetical protein
MTTAFVQLYTKNDVLLGDRVEITTQVVPRVGELIDADEFLELSGKQVGDFIVMSVVYKLTGNGFVPYISARQWHKGFRFELLQERGWLIPDDTAAMSYDEDDLARAERID